MLAKCFCTCWIDVEESTSDKAHAHKTRVINGEQGWSRSYVDLWQRTQKKTGHDIQSCLLTSLRNTHHCHCEWSHSLRVFMWDVCMLRMCVCVQAAWLWRKWVRLANKEAEGGLWLSPHLLYLHMQTSSASFMTVCLSVHVCRNKMHCAWPFKCVGSQFSSSGPIFRSGSASTDPMG